MGTFISIIKLDGGAASYRVVESSSRSYTAYLVKNTSSTLLPSEVVIDHLHTQRPSIDSHPLMDKLLATIKSTAALGEDHV